VEQLEAFSHRPDMRGASFSEILLGFVRTARCSNLFFLCDIEDVLERADVLDEIDNLSASFLCVRAHHCVTTAVTTRRGRECKRACPPGCMLSASLPACAAMTTTTEACPPLVGAAAALRLSSMLTGSPRCCNASPLRFCVVRPVVCMCVHVLVCVLVCVGALVCYCGAGLADCAIFCQAPVDTGSEKCLLALYDYASAFAQAVEQVDEAGNPLVHVPAGIHVPRGVPQSPAMIATLEEWHKVGGWVGRWVGGWAWAGGCGGR
jgi:hypothetical protein